MLNKILLDLFALCSLWLQHAIVEITFCFTSNGAQKPNRPRFHKFTYLCASNEIKILGHRWEVGQLPMKTGNDWIFADGAAQLLGYCNYGLVQLLSASVTMGVAALLGLGPTV